MAKKIDYASMYTLRSDGRYMGYWRDNKGTRHAIYDRDPERLYGKIQDAERPKEKTFGEVAEAWENTHVAALSEGTQSAYSAPLKSVIAEHGKMALENVTAQEINRVMLREKAQGLSYKHAACTLSMYKQIFDFAIVQGYAVTNPAASVQVPRGMPRSHREAPEDDVIRVIQQGLNQPFGIYAYFLLYSGFRSGEAMGIKWGDVDFEAKTINCSRSVERHAGKPHEKGTKTEAGMRTVPLLNDLAAALKAYKPSDAKDDDYIFSVDGRLMTNSELRSRWVRWAKSVGLAELHETTIKGADGKPRKKTYYKATLTAHQLRHAYATLLFEADVDELTVTDLMGHADISTTHKIYTHLRQKQKDKATDKLNAKFAEISAGTKETVVKQEAVVNAVVKTRGVTDNAGV